MKYILLSSMIFLATACGISKRGSGNIVSETKNVTTFTKVNVSSSIDVDVQQGNETSVVVEADDNLIKYVEVNVINNELKIRMKDMVNLRNATIKVHVVAPQYNGFISSASSEIVSNSVITSTDKITLKASSSSKIEIQLDAPYVSADASSSADIVATGRTRELTAEGSSSASINLSNLRAEVVTVIASSSSDVSVFGSLKINAAANSSGDITYTGGAKDIVKKENSSGSITGQ
jgi:Putative auto-transporter adhesin, head GIN domain